MDTNSENTDLEFLYFLLIILKYLKMFIKLESQQLRLYAAYADIILKKESIMDCKMNGLTEIANGLLELNESTLRKHLRIGIAAFKKLLSILPEKRSGRNKNFELILFLFWLASGTSYRVTGRTFNLTRFMVKTIIHRKLKEFESLVSRCIKYPSCQKYEIIGAGFNQHVDCGIFNKAVGAIAVTDIRIKCPVELQDQYINKNNYYSIKMQAVCDHSGRFLSAFIGYPGSVHDQVVLQKSPLYINATYPPPGYYLLGDSRYTSCLHPIALISAIKENQMLNDRDRRFNDLLSKAHSIIKLAFASLKTRWKNVFNKELELSIEHCIQATAACCIIHNICLSTKDPLHEIDAEFINEMNSEELNDGSDEDATEDVKAFREELLHNLLV